MHINRVILKNFRNIADADIELGQGINVMYGENAQGKTNFLESVYFCATSRSHRGGRDKDLIMMGQKETALRISVESQGYVDEIKIGISKDGKETTINGLPASRLGDLFGRLCCVIFSPEDLSLVKAGPGVRRRFMDMELCQMYPSYYHDLRMYYRVLKQRNNLLKEITKNRKLIESLEIWDAQLVLYGNKIMSARRIFVDKLSTIACENQRKITDNQEELTVAYKNQVNEYEFLDKLARNRDFDILRGSTGNGIHKDDIEFKINGICGRVFASQGQQRTAALAVKLAQIDLLHAEKGHLPVLLLDDVLSELDAGRQNYLLGRIEGLQTIITLTGAESAVGGYLRQHGVKIFNVEKGVFSVGDD